MFISKFEPYHTLFDLLVDYYEDNISIDDLNEFMDYLISVNYNDINFLKDYISIIDNLLKYGILTYDFLNLNNIGYLPNTNKLVYFDIGFGKFDMPQFDNIEISKFYFEDEKEIFELLNIKDYVEIGFGGNGTAYSFGNKVIKITQDESEVYNSYKLKLLEIENINFIHDVYQFTILNIVNKWCIIQDKLVTDKSDLIIRLKNINNLFNKFKTNEII